VEEFQDARELSLDWFVYGSRPKCDECKWDKHRDKDESPKPAVVEVPQTGLR
jgi:hypothetical protein